MWDPRVILCAVHRYGEACRSNDHVAAGVLYSEIVRMIEDEKEPPRSSSGEDERGGLSP